MLIKLTLTQDEIYLIHKAFEETVGEDIPFPPDLEGWDENTLLEILDKVDGNLNVIILSLSEKVGLASFIFHIENIESIKLPEIILNVTFKELE